MSRPRTLFLDSFILLLSPNLGLKRRIKLSKNSVRGRTRGKNGESQKYLKK